ncbi:TRAP transporter small permease subunit [Hyphomicrobium sp.]|uniref:TRAP transporter small permease subunit n=1 Tax=Hyphomicrobium sp. TaxID=82 RepID=UPI003F70FA4D
MKELLAVSRLIDRASGALGRSVAWLIVVAAVISASNAVVRKAFDWSANSLLEVQWWLFAAVFLLAAPWTLAVNEHIRIDVVNSRLSARARNIIELIGHAVFLLPTAAMIVYTSSIFFANSYAQNEQSPNAGGLPQWPVKILIPIAFAWLFAQGISELIKRIAIMRGDLAEPVTHGSYHEAAIEAGSDQSHEGGGPSAPPAGRT